ncbi:MAG: two-component sensor histidine kinase [Fluviicola sp.]|nr:MAG: two-component sensor histidine kinase [Fluviicola sp.]
MKSKKPVHIILLGSLILFGVTLGVLLLVNYFLQELDVLTVFITSLGVGVFSFLIFFLFVERFINDKIRLLYRVIRKGKTEEQEHTQISMADDVIGKAAKETEDWAQERQREISKLKEQAAFRREFLGNLAHELKTPVFSIQGYILTLLEGGLEDESVNRKFLERASFATERITSILQDLDEITDMEVNRFQMNIERFDLVKLTNDIIESTEVSSREKEVCVKLHKQYDPIYVKGDKSRIAQVLTNLILNSINYGEKGGETIVRFYPMDDVIMTEVSDNGPGISEKDIPRLFERFYRVEQSRNRNEGGSGLGLAICKHIIESHGQNINVQSTVGVGSTFSFTLEKA